MKKKLSLIGIAMAIMVFAICTSCEKVEGPQGPAGIDGQDGNANVITHVISVTTWVFDGVKYITQIPLTELTSDVHNNGTVQVFFSHDDGINWIALPFIKIINSTSGYHMYYETSVNSIVISWIFMYQGYGVDPNQSYNATAKFKIVIIPSM